ncbi:guanine deaminase [Endozoicomonas sp. Mp262]|uniref:guanine deaminase n=1 Tax=Endozoicomonas sp. Mp262 TaxID=2919499 RepID=UPI0021DA4ADA
MKKNPVVWRASTLHFLDDPARTPTKDAVEFHEDGAVVVDDGHILAAGAYQSIAKHLPAACETYHLPGKLLIPGFVDTHVHYPQLGMTGACGEQLIQWLERYTFPAEAAFDSPDYAREVARFFLDQCLAHGTTTALVFGAVFPESVTAFFEAASERQLRMIAGKVMMDRNAPDYLLDTATTSYEESQQLIRHWHGKNRLAYAVTPRFAPTSTPNQLKAARRLLDEFDGLYLHTHLAENLKEVAWTHKLYPDSQNYLDVYDQYGLLGSRSFFAHAIHLCEASWQRLADTGSSLSFCPSANLFLGSGLFDFQKASSLNINIGLGTDIGAGTSLCQLESMKSAYQVCQLQGTSLSPLSAFYLATLGGARALGLSDKIGSFTPGNEADFLILNPRATPLLAFRMKQAKTLEERLGIMMTLGDDRLIENTVIMGETWQKKTGEYK